MSEEFIVRDSLLIKYGVGHNMFYSLPATVDTDAETNLARHVAIGESIFDVYSKMMSDPKNEGNHHSAMQILDRETPHAMVTTFDSPTKQIGWDYRRSHVNQNYEVPLSGASRLSYNLLAVVDQDGTKGRTLLEVVTKNHVVQEVQNLGHQTADDFKETVENLTYAAFVIERNKNVVRLFPDNRNDQTQTGQQAVQDQIPQQKNAL